MSGGKYWMEGMIWNQNMVGIRSDLIYKRFLVAARHNELKRLPVENCFYTEEKSSDVKKNVQKLGRRPGMGTGEPGCRNGKH